MVVESGLFAGWPVAADPQAAESAGEADSAARAMALAVAESAAASRQTAELAGMEDSRTIA